MPRVAGRAYRVALMLYVSDRVRLLRFLADRLASAPDAGHEHPIVSRSGVFFTSIAAFEHHFRVTEEEFVALVDALRIPRVTVMGGCVFDGAELLALGMYRLHFPTTIEDMSAIFQCSAGRVSTGINTALNVLDAAFGCKLGQLPVGYLRSIASVAAERFVVRGSPNRKCIGALDGTLRRIARPSLGGYTGIVQESTYSGMDKVHGLKYLCVTLPNGLIIMFGPKTGNTNDSTLLLQSGWSIQMAGDNMLRDYVFIVDRGFGYRNNLVVGPVRRPRLGDLTAEEKRWNKALSRVRTSVEWSFGAVANSFQHLEMKRYQRVLETPVALQYRAAVFLSNCRTCMRGGNVVSKYFGMPPPSLAEYLGLLNG